MTRGDIVLIKFPFSDATTTKVRPALVISSDQYNRLNTDPIFVALSSKISNAFSYDILIDNNDPEFPATGLKAPTLIKSDKIARITRSHAVRQLGCLGPNVLNKVDAKIREVLGLL